MQLQKRTLEEIQEFVVMLSNDIWYPSYHKIENIFIVYLYLKDEIEKFERGEIESLENIAHWHFEKKETNNK